MGLPPLNKNHAAFVATVCSIGGHSVIVVVNRSRPKLAKTEFGGIGNLGVEDDGKR